VTATLSATQEEFFDGKLLEFYIDNSNLGTFWAQRTGASQATLKRRVRYGGRKGRSAARRLRRQRLSWEQLLDYCNERYGLAL
jgi:hypothetical protein